MGHFLLRGISGAVNFKVQWGNILTKCRCFYLSRSVESPLYRGIFWYKYSSQSERKHL